MKGMIKFYNNEKGYGFIETTTADIFFHISAVKNKEMVESGESVEFDTIEKDRGTIAINITVSEETK